jgi:hypothetical protein
MTTRLITTAATRKPPNEAPVRSCVTGSSRISTANTGRPEREADSNTKWLVLPTHRYIERVSTTRVEQPRDNEEAVATYVAAVTVTPPAPATRATIRQPAADIDSRQRNERLGQVERKIRPCKNSPIRNIRAA